MTFSIPDTSEQTLYLTSRITDYPEQTLYLTCSKPENADMLYVGIAVWMKH